MSNLYPPRRIALRAREYTPLSSARVYPPPLKNGSVAEAEGVLNEMDSPEYSELDDVVLHASPRKLSNYQPLRTSGSQKGWKPTTLRAPVLVGFVLISMFIIALLEVLSHRSSGRNGGGLVFASDLDSLPTLTTFGYLYFPTILAVFYSMMWSWVDLDVKRLEPWFQLSKQNGAPAKDSLCLQYPFDFLPFIPLNALRRRHWGVFFAGSIMLMVFWIITPLQSAIFSTGTVTRSVETNMMTTGQLVPINQQASALNANFLNTAYGISWLNQSLPAFSTRQYTVFPFQPYPMHPITTHTEIWTTVADTFSTSLSCTPANITLAPDGYTFSNGKGCTAKEIELDDTQDRSSYLLDYIGYFNDANVDNALSTGDCPPEFSNNFLALWASGASRNSGLGRPTYNNLTALFCETSYHAQRFSVVVNASGNAIVSGTPIIDKSNKTNTVDVYFIFNTTTFEYIIGAGVMPVDQPINLPGRARLSQFPRLAKYNLTRDLVNNMVQFAVALNPVTIDDLSSPVALQRAFEMAHQLLFTTAFTSLLDQTNNTTDSPGASSPGILQDTLGAITLVRPVAIAVEAAFTLVAIFASALWYFSHQRPSKLKRDPSSIGEIMSLMQERQITPSIFDGIDRLNDKDICSILADKSYRLSNSDFAGDIFDANSRSRPDEQDLSDRTSGSAAAIFVTSRVGDSFAVRPREFHLGVGIALCAIILGTASGLIFLYTRSVQYGGLHLPSHNPVVLSIIENYLPTAFATFFEPIWVILNRMLCLLIPFQELRRGNSRSKDSIKAEYTSLPPQLVIWRALRSGQFLLAAVCLVAVSTNLLSVTLSTLLNEGSVRVNVPVVSYQLLRPVFNDTGTTSALDFNTEGYDHFYTLLSNLSHNTSLPSWVDQNYFYFPFSHDMPPGLSGSSPQPQQFRGSTVGLGVEATCNDLSPGEGNNEFLLHTSLDGSNISLQTSHLLANGTPVTCLPAGGGWLANQSITQFPLGDIALEIMQPMHPLPGLDDGGFCSNLLVVGWARAVNSKYASSNSTTFNSSNATLVACTGALQAAQFQIIVDTTGHILNSKQISNFSTDTAQYFTGNASELQLINEAVNLLNPVSPGTAIDYSESVSPIGTWHNRSYTSDWINSLLVITESQDLVDPSAPVPDGKMIAPVLKQLYQQLFAVSLALTAPKTFPLPADPNTFLVEAIVVETRLFVSPVMFKISLALLLFHFVVAILYYLCRPKKFLPRMPTSIAAVISYVYTSRALEDFGDSRTEGKGKLDGRYAFGRFIGTDGKTHVGIERQRYVVPLESENPAVRRRIWAFRKGQRDENLPKTWI